MGKNTVKTEQLMGYRAPTALEKEKILQYMMNDVGKSIKLFNIIKVVCVCTDAVLIMGMLGMSGNYSAREKVVMLILAVLLTLVIFSLNASRKNDKKFLNLLKEGRFQVLDCGAYKVDLGSDVVGGAAVYICTEYGQYCEQRFVVDYLSAKEWTQKKEVSFLLMKAVRGKGVCYELFSERKLNR